MNEYLAFILSEPRINWLDKFLKEFNSLPIEIKRKIRRFGLFNLFLPEGKERFSRVDIMEKLIRARTLNKEGKPLFMPFIDFLNHDYKNGLNYQGEKGEVVVKGMASQETGEVFAIYNLGDNFHFLNTYFFVPERFVAYSALMSFKLAPGIEVNIFRDFTKFEVVCNNQLKISQFKIDFKKINLMHLWVGSRFTPRRPFWSFQKLWEDKLGKKGTVKIFSLIKSNNLELLISLLEDLDKLEENTAVKLLKRAVFNQLKLIAESIEDTTERLC